MARVKALPKLETLNFRVDADLKQRFLARAESEDRSAGQLLRDCMRAYVDRAARIESPGAPSERLASGGAA